MKLFFKRLFNFFHLCFLSDYNKLLEENNKLNNDVIRLEDRIRNTEFKTMEEYKKENHTLKREQDKIRSEIKEATNFYITIQKKLNDNVATIKDFVFPESKYGSFSNVKTRYDDKHVTITGKFILTDDYTQKLHDATSMIKKREIIVKFMKDYCIAEKILNDMISNGALPMILTYNSDSTTAEVFYTIKASSIKEIFTENNEEEG